MKRSPINRRTPLRRSNPKRRAELRARNFGSKADWICTLPCHVTGKVGRVVPAHVKSRGAGGDSRHIVPFDLEVEIDWHQLGNLRFYEKYGTTKQSCRRAAAYYDDLWERGLP